MAIEKGLKYTKEHEWVLLEENVATIGITDFAQESLGDITYVQLPKEGESVQKNDSFGVVESVKAVSDLYAPVSGRIVEVNQPLLEAPELINEDPYQEGWMLKIELSNDADVEDLMSADEYKDYVEENS
ncbi:MAG: glycine cleavage system protein GcvH [Deltaproteobacteria bacterium]|nr:glycine cleavage system protein GcvH [Deltaproteobacteria bacterium]